MEQNKTRAPHATNAVLSGAFVLLKTLVKRGITLKYSFQSYDPCLATAPCYHSVDNVYTF